MIEHQNSILWEVTFSEFFFVTLVLGGAAAMMTGRAIARSWLSPWHLVGSIVLLAMGVRFIHFALFEGSFIAPWYYVVDLVCLLVFAFLGMRLTRAKQMTTRYAFKYRRSSPFGWSAK